MENIAHNQRKNQSVKTNSKLIKIMELAGKEVKTAVRNMFKLLKKKQEQCEDSMEDIF